MHQTGHPMLQVVPPQSISPSSMYQGVHQMHPVVHQVPPQTRPHMHQGSHPMHQGSHPMMHQAGHPMHQTGPHMHQAVPPQSMGPSHPMGPAQAPTTSAHPSHLSTLANNVPLPHSSASHHNIVNSSVDNGTIRQPMLSNSSASHQNPVNPGSGNAVIRHPPPQNQVSQQQIANGNPRRSAQDLQAECNVYFRLIQELHFKYHSQLKHEQVMLNFNSLYKYKNKS